jgi:hypothetical protein
MRLVLFFVFSLFYFLSFSQDKSVLDELLYKSVTKELIKQEQFNYYEDEYRVYIWFKPSLVKHATVIIYVNGIPVKQQSIRVTQYNNRFEIKKQKLLGMLVVYVGNDTYIVNVKSVD